jgi:hypothetical protein
VTDAEYDIGWIHAVNWLWTVGFAVAALWFAHSYFTHRQAGAATSTDRGPGIACQAIMAVGWP